MIRERLRRLPNTALLYLTFVIAVGSAVLATMPIDANPTAPVPIGEAERLEAAAATSTIDSVPVAADPAQLVEVGGTTTTSLLLGLETQPRTVDGVIECGPPLFELTVPQRDQRVAPNDDCRDGAISRVAVASLGGVLALLVGLTARRLRIGQDERIAKEERRRLLHRQRGTDPAERVESASRR